MPTIPLWWYLIVASTLFAIGLYGALTRRNAVSVLMGVELMLNAVNLNAVAFWRYISPTVSSGGEPYVAALDGQVFAIFVIALAASEAAVGLALIIAIYRSRRTIDVEQYDMLQG